jgi:hypothetical protein
LEYDSESAPKEELLKHSLGRSGTLRAPTFILKSKVIIGFNQELYENEIQ